MNIAFKRIIEFFKPSPATIREETINKMKDYALEVISVYIDKGYLEGGHQCRVSVFENWRNPVDADILGGPYDWEPDYYKREACTRAVEVLRSKGYMARFSLQEHSWVMLLYKHQQNS